MGRKKGDLNQATRKRLAEEKSNANSKRKLFDFHKILVAPSAKKEDEHGSSIGDGKAGNTSVAAADTHNASINQLVDTPVHDVLIPSGSLMNNEDDKSAYAGPTTQEHANVSEKDKNNYWIKELIALNYHICNIDSPATAVQIILGCIKGKDTHSLITFKECNLLDKRMSPVTFYGFNGWFKVYQLMKGVNFQFTKCKEIIDHVYDDINSVLYERTCLEDELAKKFMIGLSALEKANDIVLTFDDKKGDNNSIAEPDVDKPSGCLFSDEDLIEEISQNHEIQFDADGVVGNETSSEDVPNLTLGNSACFPIIIEQSVEAYSAVYSYAIWESQNFGAIAPLSLDTLMALSGVNKEDIKYAKVAATRLDKVFQKPMEVDLPFKMDFFGLTCSKNTNIQLAQKGHMAFPNMDRDDFYLKRIYRTHCPYFKCKCEKSRFPKKKDECDCGIIWIDHGLWYILNHLEELFPGSTPIMKMVALTKILNQELKPAIIAYAAYLEVRKLMIDMTMEYAETPEKNLKVKFGNNRLADIAEKTIKPISFLSIQAPNRRATYAQKALFVNKNKEMRGSNVCPKLAPRIMHDPKGKTDSIKAGFNDITGTDAHVISLNDIDPNMELVPDTQ